MKKKKYHLIGIGGISTSAIAKHLLKQGHEVSGSDVVCNAETEKLQKLGAKIFIGHDPSNLSAAEEVIYNSAIGKDNAELLFALKKGLPAYDRIDFLKKLSEGFGVSVGVAGCHGKTTATAMIADVLFFSGRKFLAHIGGEDNNLGNYHYSGDDIFLTEVCEFNKNIRRLPTEIACLLNVGFDHADCYSDPEELKNVYLEFLNRARFRIVNADDDSLSGIKENAFSYGILKPADFNADNILETEDGISFSVRYKNGEFPVKIKAFGRHNVYNALCAAAACKFLKLSDKAIAEGLGRFAGIKRRFETVGYVNGAKIICDYAHHPEEIAAAIKTAKALFRKRLFIIFQPHTYSRTKAMMKEFAEVLSENENTLIYKTYPARETYSEEGSAYELYKKSGAEKYFDEPEDLKKYLREKLMPSDAVLALGAGDIYDIVKSFS